MLSSDTVAEHGLCASYGVWYVRCIQFVRSASLHMQCRAWCIAKLVLRLLLLQLLLLGGLSVVQAQTAATVQSADARWVQGYDARMAWYEKNLGVLPANIVKMRNMVGVWRGGGLLAFPATKLGDDVWAYATSGLTNSDMPATLLQESESVDAERNGRVRAFALNLRPKEPAPTAPGMAGYGYELLMLLRRPTVPQEKAQQKAQQQAGKAVAASPEKWPLWVLQWLVTAEIYKDVGVRRRVLEHNGLILHSIGLDGGERVNLLIVPAPAPLVRDMDLPHGTAVLLLAIAISDAEVRWAARNGHEALFARLVAASSSSRAGGQAASPYAGLLSSRTRLDVIDDDESTRSRRGRRLLGDYHQ